MEVSPTGIILYDIDFDRNNNEIIITSQYFDYARKMFETIEDVKIKVSKIQDYDNFSGITQYNYKWIYNKSEQSYALYSTEEEKEILTFTPT